MIKKKYIKYLKPGERINTKTPRPLNIYRILSLPITDFLSKTRVTPNQVTWTGLILTIALTVCLMTNRYPLLILGGVLWFIAKTVDAIDGVLARMKNMVSLYGKFADVISDQASTFLPFLGMAIGASIKQPIYYLRILKYFDLLSLRIVIVWVIAFICVLNLLNILKLNNEFNHMYPKNNIPTSGKIHKKSFMKKIISILTPDLHFMTAPFFIIGFLLNQMLLFMFLFAIGTTPYLFVLIVYYIKKMGKIRI